VVGIVTALIGGLVVVFVLPAGKIGERHPSDQRGMAPVAGELEPSD